MLKFLAGRKRSRNALLIFFVGVLTLSLVGLFSFVVGGGTPGIFGSGEATVAKVGSHKVTLKEVREALAARGQQMAFGQGRQGTIDSNTIYGIMGDQVINDIVRDKVALYEAERLNIQASDEDVAAFLKRNFGAMLSSPEQYRAFIKQQYGPNMTPIEFEDRIVRPSITIEHLRSYITAGVQVSADEVKEQFRRNNTTYDIRWAEVNPDFLTDQVQVNQADLRPYFEQHKDEFRIKSEARRARYIFVDQKTAGQAATVPDEELRKVFDESPDRYVQHVRVSQIVLGFSEANKEEDVRKKAQEIIQRARGSEGKPAEDFAKLAREVSEDAASKARGGDIGIINKSDKRDNNDPLTQAFNIKEGDLSEPIKKNDKFYILKVTERTPPTFAEARQQIQESMRSGRAYDKAVEIAREAEARLKETKNPDAVVAEINSKYNAPLATVKDTGFFSKGDKVSGLEDAPDFESTLFEMQNIGDISTWMSVKDGFAVAVYTDKREPNDQPPYEDVAVTVEQKYRRSKAEEIAADLARQIAQAKSADELKARADALIRQYGSGKQTLAVPIKVDEQSSVKLGDSLGPLVSEADRAPVYKLNTGEVTSEPIRVESGSAYAVVAVKERKNPKEEDFEGQRKSIEQSLLSSKRNVYFQTYMAMTTEQLKKDGTITIYKEVADAAFKGQGPGDQQNPSSPFQGMPAPSQNRPRRTPQGATPGALPGRE